MRLCKSKAWKKSNHTVTGSHKKKKNTLKQVHKRIAKARTRKAERRKVRTSVQHANAMASAIDLMLGRGEPADAI